jgi:RimJ/RimL family protein N-acetyltransferase
MFIRSERLFLRPGWAEDWQELRARIDDRAVARHLAYTPQAAEAYLADPQYRRFPHFLVTLPTSEDSRLLGCVGLLYGAGAAELVYWIAPEHWGQGYATEAARALLSLARTLGHRLITAFHFCDNPASARVLAKLGFRDTGEVCERLCPARGDFAASRVHRRDLGEASDCDGSLRSRWASAA